MGGKSGHHTRRRKANGFGPAPYTKCRVRKVPQRQYYPELVLEKGEKSFGVFILITWIFMRKKKRLQVIRRNAAWKTLSDARRMVSK
jgi:predicted CopG family antitoxin